MKKKRVFFILHSLGKNIYTILMEILTTLQRTLYQKMYLVIGLIINLSLNTLLGFVTNNKYQAYLG